MQLSPPDQVLAGKVRLRPRRLGIGFLLVNVAMLLAAINYGNNLVYLITFLLFSLLANSGWQTRRLLRQFELSALPPAPRHADRTGELRLTLRSRQPIAVTLSIDGLPGRSVLVQADTPTPLSLILPTEARGHRAPPPVYLSSDYPLGLWNASRTDQPLAKAWIYPRAAGNQPLPSPANRGSEAQNPLRGDDQLDHLRPYIPGDSLSRLAFKHYARTGELVTKAFMGQSGAEGVIELDFDQMSGDTEGRLSQLTQWVVQLAEEDRPFCLNLPDHRQPTGQGAQHVRQALEALATSRSGHHRTAIPGQQHA